MREVVRIPPLTEIPLAAPGLLGVMSLWGRCCRCTISGGGSGYDLGEGRTVLGVDVGVLMEEIFSPERAGFM